MRYQQHAWDIEFINKDRIYPNDIPEGYIITTLPKFHIAPIIQRTEGLYKDRVVYNYCAIHIDSLKWVVQCVGVAETSIGNQRKICNRLLEKLKETSYGTYISVDIFQVCVNVAEQMCFDHNNQDRDKVPPNEFSIFRTEYDDHQLLQVPIYDPLQGSLINCELVYCQYLIGLYMQFLLMETIHPYDSPLQIVAIVLALAVLSRTAYSIETMCSKDSLLANYAGFCIDMLTRARFIDRWRNTIGDITLTDIAVYSWSTYTPLMSMIGSLSYYNNTQTRIHILLANLRGTDTYPVWDALNTEEYLDLLHSCEKTGDDYGNMFYVFDINFIKTLLTFNMNKKLL